MCLWPLSHKKTYIDCRSLVYYHTLILRDKKSGGGLYIHLRCKKKRKKRYGAVIATMVERKSRFTVVAKAKNKTTKAVIGGISKAMSALSCAVNTITFDNGKEFCMHQELADTLNAQIYFATPYCSWERGLNENTNGLIRQYLPKKKAFDSISNYDIQLVANKLNHRPRKCLGYKTPFEVFSVACKRKGIALRI